MLTDSFVKNTIFTEVQLEVQSFERSTNIVLRTCALNMSNNDLMESLYDIVDLRQPTLFKNKRHFKDQDDCNEKGPLNKPVSEKYQITQIGDEPTNCEDDMLAGEKPAVDQSKVDSDVLTDGDCVGAIAMEPENMSNVQCIDLKSGEIQIGDGDDMLTGKKHAMDQSNVDTDALTEGDCVGAIAMAPENMSNVQCIDLKSGEIQIGDEPTNCEDDMLTCKMQVVDPSIVDTDVLTGGDCVRAIAMEPPDYDVIDNVWKVAYLVILVAQFSRKLLCWLLPTQLHVA